jgi:hypothetical protein
MSEKKTKTIKFVSNVNKKEEFEIKGVTHIVILFKKNTTQNDYLGIYLKRPPLLLFFIKNKEISKNIERMYKGREKHLPISEIKIKFEENIFEIIEEEKYELGDIIKLERNIKYMDFNYDGYLLRYINFVTNKTNFKYGYNNKIEKKYVFNFEKGMRGIYGKKVHDEENKIEIIEFGFFYEKYQEIENKIEKNYLIPKGKVLISI